MAGRATEEAKEDIRIPATSRGAPTREKLRMAVIADIASWVFGKSTKREQILEKLT